MAAACVGTGQQLFVVLRNQYLHDLGLSPQWIATVQGAGAAAGVPAGLVGLWVLGRLPSRTLFGAAVLANALGFGLQAVARSMWLIVVGSALAGFGIQFLTMASAPFLLRSSSSNERLLLFGLNAIAVQTLPGALGSLLGGQIHGLAGRVMGSSLAGYRVALALGTASVALALYPLRGVRERAPVDPRPMFSVRDPWRVARLLAPDVLIFFGTGLTVPFLQLYLHRTLGFSPTAVGWLYASMALAGSAGHLASASLARRVGTWQLVLVAQLLALPLFAELALVHSVALAVTAFVLRHVLVTLSGPLASSFLQESVAPEDAPALASYRMLSQSLAWATANFLAGPLMALDRGGFRYMIAATAGAYLAAVASGVWCWSRPSTRRA